MTRYVDIDQPLIPTTDYDMVVTSSGRISKKLFDKWAKHKNKEIAILKSQVDFLRQSIEKLINEIDDIRRENDPAGEAGNIGVSLEIILDELKEKYETDILRLK